MLPSGIEIGTRFGRLVVVGEGDRIRQRNGKTRRTLRLRCDCGRQVDVPAYNLRRGNSTSCGCRQREKASARMAAPEIPASARYGRLVVLERTEPFINREGARLQQYRCRCDCGTEKMVRGVLLRRGNTRSCGCLDREVARERLTTHGGAGSPEYLSWANMLQRCTNPTNKAFKNYGGRGITVCDRWRSDFSAFLADMGPRPSPEHSLDREDVNGNYEPGNVRWATKKVQGRNKRPGSLRIVSYRGRDMTLKEACELAGKSYGKVYQRIRAGWPLEKALA